MDSKEFAALLPALQAELELALREELALIGKSLATKAADRLGNEQDDWPELSEATINDKIRRGDPVPSPLLRTGELKQSIGSEVEGETVFVGSNNSYAKYHEYGTEKMPARPIFATVLHQQLPDIEAQLGNLVIATLNGKKS